MIHQIMILHNNRDLVIEIIKALPAFIALIITLVVPLINKNLEIQKNKANFIYAKRFDIFEKHFNKLYELRNATIELISTLMYHYEHESYTDVSDINLAKDILYNNWNEVKKSEASLWLFAECNQLCIRGDLLKSIKHLFEKINSLSNNGVLLLKKTDIEDLIKITKDLQKPITQILESYREIFTVNK